MPQVMCFWVHIILCLCCRQEALLLQDAVRGKHGSISGVYNERAVPTYAEGAVLCCRQIQSHKQGLAPLQEKHADAARRQKEIDMKSHKLGDNLDKARANADHWDKTTAEHSDSALSLPRTPLPPQKRTSLCTFRCRFPSPCRDAALY